MENKKETYSGSNYFYRLSPTEKHLGGNIIGGDPYTYTPILWNWLKEKYKPHTILDVGAGEGHAVKYFRSIGVMSLGIDGLQENITNSVAPVVLHDITKGRPNCPSVDMVWCCELVEHIDEEFVDRLIDVLTLGTIIVMTHANPGQVGFHHVNCKADSYWISKIVERGYILLKEDTEYARAIAIPDNKDLKLSWFSISGLIFKKTGI